METAVVVLVSAYAGWAGSLPPEATQQRLPQALALADLSPDEFVAALLPTMFADGFRAMARASAEDLRDALPSIDVPPLLLYGDHDVRAPLTVAEQLDAAITGPTLVVRPGAGHVCNVEAADELNTAVHELLQGEPS